MSFGSKVIPRRGLLKFKLQWANGEDELSLHADTLSRWNNPRAFLETAANGGWCDSRSGGRLTFLHIFMHLCNYARAWQSSWTWAWHRQGAHSSCEPKWFHNGDLSSWSAVPGWRPVEGVDRFEGEIKEGGRKGKDYTPSSSCFSSYKLDILSLKSSSDNFM